jgi:hypothetical protein
MALLHRQVGICCDVARLLQARPGVPWRRQQWHRTAGTPAGLPRMQMRLLPAPPERRALRRHPFLGWRWHQVPVWHLCQSCGAPACIGCNDHAICCGMQQHFAPDHWHARVHWPPAVRALSSSGTFWIISCDAANSGTRQKPAKMARPNPADAARTSRCSWDAGAACWHVAKAMQQALQQQSWAMT